MRSKWSRTIQSLHCKVDSGSDDDEDNLLSESVNKIPIYSLAFFNKFQFLKSSFWEELDFINSPKVMIRVAGSTIDGVHVDAEKTDYLNIFIPESKFINVKLEAIKFEDDILKGQPSHNVISPENLVDKLISDDRHYSFIMFCNDKQVLDDFHLWIYKSETINAIKRINTFKKKVLELLKNRYC